MADPDLSQTGLEGEAGQPKSRHFGDIKARFKVDDEGLKDLNKHFVSLNKETKDFQGRLRGLTSGTKAWADELKRVADYMKQIGPGAGGGGAGGGGGGVYSAGGALSSFGPRPSSTVAPIGASPLNAPAAAPGGGRNLINQWQGAQEAFGGTKVGMYGTAALAIVGSAVSTMDTRIQGAAGGVLEADRIGLMFRQMQAGMTTTQYAGYRQGLANYRLGEGGANALLGLEAFTGIGAAQQAGSIESMRQATGFTMTSAQGANMLRGLADPAANNRMTMMLGTGLVGPGGQQRDMNQVVQDIISRTGLSDPRVAQSARTPGSRTREMLRMSGVPEDMIDYIILRANQQGPGGAAKNAGAVDTSYAGAQEDVLKATQQREEAFYREQVDNYEVLAERTAGLITKFKELEDLLGGIIGTGISTSPWRRNAGTIGTAGGALVGGIIGSIVPGAGTVAGAAVGSMIGGNIGNAIGDAVPSNGGATTTSAGSATPQTPKNLEGAVTTESWQKMHTNMKQRLLRMFKDNPALSFGNGYRSPALQRQMFMARHRVDPNGKISFEGKRWSRLAGYPATAAPGRSMHEIGLAADIGPKSQYGWIVANASRYGFQVGTSFGEPWHIQPAELPMSRSRYEAAGAAWGTSPGGSEAAEEYEPSADLSNKPDVLEREGAPETAPGGGGGYLSFDNNASIAEVIQAQFDANRGMTLAGGTSPAGSGGRSVSSGPAQASTLLNTPGSDSFKAGGAGTLTGEQMAKLVATKGLRGDAMAKAIAIAYGESRFNPGATGDVALQTSKWGPSLGLWQVRSVNAERGKGTSRDASRLKDPQFNANSMYEISGGGNNWKPWSVYTSGTYQQHMNAAKTSMQAVGMGDAIADPPSTFGGGGGGSVSIRQGAQVTIAPQITIQGGGGSRSDAQRIANEVIRILESSSALQSLRES